MVIFKNSIFRIKAIRTFMFISRAATCNNWKYIETVTGYLVNNIKKCKLSKLEGQTNEHQHINTFHNQKLYQRN